MKKQKRKKFDISNFLTENKITQQSKRLDEKKDLKKVKVKELGKYMPGIDYVFYDKKSGKFFFDMDGEMAELKNKGTLKTLHTFLKKKNIKLESINETKFFVWYKKKKHEVEGKSLYDAKKKFIQQNNVPKSKQSTLAIKSAGSMEKGDFRFEDINEAVDSSMLDMDARAVKDVYRKASGKDKKIFNTAIEAYNNKNLEKDYKLVDKVGDALYDYTWEIFSNAPDDEVFIDEDSVLDIIDIMSRVNESKNGFDISNFLTENKLTEQSKNLNS